MITAVPCTINVVAYPSIPENPETGTPTALAGIKKETDVPSPSIRFDDSEMFTPYAGMDDGRRPMLKLD